MYRYSMKYSITSQPVYEKTADGRDRIGIPTDWKKFYACGCPNGRARYGAWNPSSGMCNAVFRYERQLRDHMTIAHGEYMSRRHLSSSVVKLT